MTRGAGADDGSIGDGGAASSDSDDVLRKIAHVPSWAPPAEGAPPERLAHFRVIERIGAGGMGVVYRAEDEKLRRMVALKVLPPGFEEDPGRRRRFLREARAASAVSHPNLAAVYEVGEADGDVFIAMELVPGRTLREHLGRGRLTLPEAVRIVREIARGVARAHAVGIVHRDLKPDNVMIADDGAVRVLDFGLAKLPRAGGGEAASTATVEGRISGTPGYMAPEQAEGGAVDARADVFALGAMLYEMTTGARPFRGDSAMKVLIATSRDTPPRPSKVDPSVPPELERLVLRCLEKDPAARFTDAGALLEALEQVGTARGRRPGVRIAALGAAVVAACALAWVGMRSPPARPQSTPPAPAAPAALRAVTVLDLPLPATTSPEAATEYAAGMQEVRDVSWDRAEQRFRRAAELDPSMAAAFLRRALASNIHQVQTEAFARATALRGRLSERDRALMEALEPVLHRSVPDRVEALARLERIAPLYPGDIEILDWRGSLSAEGRPADALALSQEALALDPRDGLAFQVRAQSLALLGRTSEARAVLERCASDALGSDDCLLSLAMISGVEGPCAEFEATARRARDRLSYEGNMVLAGAMVAEGRPRSAVQEILEQMLPGAPRAFARLLQEARMTAVEGDLAGVETLARDLSSVMDDDETRRADLRSRVTVGALLAASRLERGDPAGARLAAEEVVQRSETWHMPATSLVAPYLDESPWLLRLAMASAPEFTRRRDAWLAQRRGVTGSYPGLLWTFGWAAPAQTPEQARDALAALPDHAPLTSYVLTSLPDAEAGRVYLLADRPGDALPYLRRAVASCRILWAPFEYLHAARDLGLALERTGDRAGACAAYRIVTDRWGAATPRSVTVQEGRPRMRALGGGAPQPASGGR